VLFMKSPTDPLLTPAADPSSDCGVDALPPSDIPSAVVVARRTNLLEFVDGGIALMALSPRFKHTEAVHGTCGWGTLNCRSSYGLNYD